MMIETIIIMRLVLVSSVLLTAGQITCAQQRDAANPTGPYLGQIPPGSTPKIFAPGLVSTEQSWEAAVSFSPDLNEVFFSYRSSVEGTENRIMHMKMVNNVWTKPQLPSFARDVTEYEAIITPDYKKVIFKSQRPNSSGKARVGGIWYSERTKEGWGDAKYFSGPINDGWIMSVTSTSDGTLYFTGSFGDGYGIYKSRFVNGEYAKPEFLPAEINKSKYFGASHPFIAPDESYVIFDAGAAQNNSELYISFKNADGRWSDAIAFGQPVNTDGYEGIATVSPDGKYLFFQRNNDVYWVDAKCIEEMRVKEKQSNQ